MHDYRYKVLQFLVDKKKYSDKDAKYRVIANCLSYLSDFYKNRRDHAGLLYQTDPE